MKIRLLPTAVAISATAVVSSGCAVVGPASIANGRAAYTDVITRTNDQQLLNMVVRMRYAEPSTLLQVTSITAQSEVNVGATGQVGVGPSSNYAGNLVPFSVSGGYRETPTISYTPITGERYFKELLTPIELDLYVLMIRAASNTRWIIEILTDAVGPLDSPVYRPVPWAESMRRAVDLMAVLKDENVLSFNFHVTDKGQISGMNMLLCSTTPEQAKQVQELLQLLNKPNATRTESGICLNIQIGAEADGANVIRLQPRSTMGLLQLATLGVELPAEHVSEGIAAQIPGNTAKPFIHVKCGKEPPPDPMVAVQYRGYWFWVDSTDITSKQGFNLLQMLLLRCLQDHNQPAPLLTLPIG